MSDLLEVPSEWIPPRSTSPIRGNFVTGVPYEWFAHLRRNAPAYWHEETDGPGFWAVTRHEDCVTVNRDAQRFSSYRKGTFRGRRPRPSSKSNA